MQLAGLGVTLGISIVGGLLTSLLLKIPIFDRVKGNALFDDDTYWLVSCARLQIEIRFYTGS